MNGSDASALDRLDALAAEIVTVATEVAVRAKAFGPDLGARARIEQAVRKLNVALDELGTYPRTAHDVTDE